MEKNVKIETDDNLLNQNQLTLEEYKRKLVFLLEPILIKEFKDTPAKQKIVTHINRIAVACIYCGDSMKRPWAKRGNFILSGKYENHYKCFNCGVFKRTDKFFEDYDVNLELDFSEYISQHTGNFDIFIGKKYDVSLLMDEDMINKYALDRDEIKSGLSLIEIEDDDQIRGWLKARLQFQSQRFLYHPIKNYLAILNLTNQNKVIGLQKRSFKKYSEKYLTYKLSKLYLGFRPGEEVLQEVDDISELFGIMQLNFNVPITLFEGPMDSFLFRNAIASSGSTKTFPLDLPLRYFYDKDPTGLKESIKKINNEEQVFLWGRFLREFGIPYRKKWDLNDIIIWFHQEDIRLPSFDQYFSDNPLDISDL